MEYLLFSLSVTGPIFVVLLLGSLFARLNLINEAFVDTGSRLTFSVLLPTLLFINISQTGFETAVNLPLISIGLGSTFLAWLILEGLVVWLVKSPADRGVVVQGSFRSNMGIIGLAYCVNAYGEPGLVAASLYLAVVTILFNVLSVITLSRGSGQAVSAKQQLASIARNPLIVSILLALVVARTGVELPAVALTTGNYFAQMTLPLALLCTGASISRRALRADWRNTLLATTGKLVLIPVLMILIGVLSGLRGMDLGILLLMASAPTAAASFVMVRAIGGNASLAASIIAVTTLGSLLTTTVTLSLLSGLEML